MITRELGAPLLMTLAGILAGVGSRLAMRQGQYRLSIVGTALMLLIVGALLLGLAGIRL